MWNARRSYSLPPGWRGSWEARLVSARTHGQCAGHGLATNNSCFQESSSVSACATAASTSKSECTKRGMLAMVCKQEGILTELCEDGHEKEPGQDRYLSAPRKPETMNHVFSDRVRPCRSADL